MIANHSPAGPSIVRRNPRAVSARLSGDQGTVVLQLDTSAYHSLNEVGALIWDALDKPIPVAELLRKVATGLGDAPPSLEADVAAFLEQLVERDLIMRDRPA